MNKEEIKRNLEYYILKTNDRVYFTFETNTNQMAKDCLNTINELELELEIANKKLDKIKEYISNYKEPLYIPDDLLKFLRSIIGGE